MILLEALIALLVLSISISGLLQLNLLLRQTADLSRQRSAALRLAGSMLESLRSPLQPTPPDVPDADARFVPAVQIEPGPGGGSDSGLNSRAVRSTVTWIDRHGQPQQLSLLTLLPPADPEGLLSAALLPMSSTSTATQAQPLRRSTRIPMHAIDLGDGQSALRVSADRIWIFDNLSGALAQQCNSDPALNLQPLTRSSLRGCTIVSGLLLAGHVRFSTRSDSLSAVDALDPRDPAINLDLRLLPQTGTRPGWECQDNVASSPAPGQNVVAFFCRIEPDRTVAGQRVWSGRLDIEPIGWTIGSAAGTFRICRYSQDRDGNGRIDNTEHPLLYQDVPTSLLEQNFLVVRGAANCPAGALPQAGLPRLETWPHQP
jgi:hypothetical protein